MYVQDDALARARGAFLGVLIRLARILSKVTPSSIPVVKDCIVQLQRSVLHDG